MLQDAIGDQRAVVVLYRGAWCPCCAITVRTYQFELLPELTRRRVALVAISSQRPDGSLTMRQKHELTFTVLSTRATRWHARPASCPPPPARRAPLGYGSAWTSRRSAQTARPGSRRRRQSLPTRTTLRDGSASTRITQRVPSPGRSLPHSAEPASEALFDGELALVTGAGRGIGRAIGLELAAAGARVALLARSAEGT